MNYIKPLDSIRAIAVLLVIISHWIPEIIIPFGRIGVEIFFVLSGFLITRILLDSKNNSERNGVSKFNPLFSFWIRRSLRIFPIYYLTLLILFLFHDSTGTNIKNTIHYFIFYLSNFYFFKIQAWDGMVSHLWSLAVEEQFYLIWPWIILFAKKSHLKIWICGFIVIGVVSQFLLKNINMGYILTFTTFDTFGFGSLLAWYVVNDEKNIYKLYRAGSIFGLILLSWIIFCITVDKVNLIPIRLTVSIFTLSILSFILLNKNESYVTGNYIFNNRILIFLGKISYGIYLYHNIIPGLITMPYVLPYLESLQFSFLPDVLDVLLFAINLLFVITISWISFQLIEKPFLKLKERISLRPFSNIFSRVKVQN